MADAPMRRGDGLPVGELPPGKPGYFSTLFQPALADPHAQRHVHPPSPVETLLLGFHFEAIAQNADGFQISTRIQGFSAILWIVTRCSRVAAAGNLHGIAIGLARSAPADVAAFNKLEQIFPFANTTTTQRNLLEWGSREDGLEIMGRFPFKPMNQALVVRFHNRGSGTNTCYVGLVLELEH